VLNSYVIFFKSFWEQTVNPLYLLIRIIFFPFQFLTILVYPELLKNKILLTYCWYRNKNDYDEIVNHSIDGDGDGDIKSYEEWLKDSELKLKSLDGEVEYIKIAMRPEQLNAWLERKQLYNNTENRKRYALEVYMSARDNGIENET